MSGALTGALSTGIRADTVLGDRRATVMAVLAPLLLIRLDLLVWHVGDYGGVGTDIHGVSD